MKDEKHKGFRISITNPEGKEVFSTTVIEINYGLRSTINGDCVIISNKELTTKCPKCNGTGFKSGIYTTLACNECNATGITDLYQIKWTKQSQRI